MNSFTFHIPTQIFVGDLVLHQSEFTGFGCKALIVTGKSSAKNGSLSDVEEILRLSNIRYVVFDEVEENPSLETVDKATELAKKEHVDFLIAIGGGSPMDAAKAISLLVNGKDLKAKDLYFPQNINGLPMIAVPTTAGTGSEVTPFSILTIHDKEVKQSIANTIFFDKAFLNGKYLMNLPESYVLSTAVDALSHLVEGYLTTKSNYLSDRIGEGALLAFGRLLPSLANRNFSTEVRNQLLYISTLAGMVITHSKTSLPHQLGYYLTYYHNVPHGFANAALMVEFLKFHENKEKINTIIQLIGLGSLDELDSILKNLTTFSFDITKEQVVLYSQKAYENKDRLAIHPYPVQLQDIIAIFENSLLK